MRSMLKFTLLVLFAYFGSITTEETNWYNINFNGNHKHIDAIFQRCTGSCNKKYCKINTSCRPLNRTSKLKRTDVYFNDGVKLEAPILLEISTFKKFRTEYRPLMLKYKKEVCELLLMESNPVFAFFGVNKKIMQKDGNLLQPCPLRGHRFENPKITTTWVGTLVPIGEWRVDFILSKVINDVEEHILTVSQYFLVKAKDAIGADEF